MARYEIQVEGEFCAAHALRLPDGTLEPVHGHNWHVTVVVGSDKLDAMGVVMDFHVLEGALTTLLAQVNNTLLNDVPPFVDHDGQSGVNPSAELVATWIGDQMAVDLPAGVTVSWVSVTEAPNCTAVYRP